MKAKLPLTVRVFECEECGYKADRDLNASVNLENYARQVLSCQPAESSLSLTTSDLVTGSQTVSVKQEESIVSTSVRNGNE